MSVVDQLVLIWKDPDTRERFAVGTLRRVAGEYLFSYENRETRRSGSLEAARARGFRLLESFLELKEYRSSTLFPAFQRRIPPKLSTELRKRVEKMGDGTLDPMTILSVTGGRQPTDTLELMENTAWIYRPRTISFPLMQHCSAPAGAKTINVGDPVRLRLELENQHDRSAIAIYGPDSTKLGYVPALYARYVDEIVNAGSAGGIVSKAVVVDGFHRMVIEMKARALDVNNLVELASSR